MRPPLEEEYAQHTHPRCLTECNKTEVTHRICHLTNCDSRSHPGYLCLYWNTFYCSFLLRFSIIAAFVCPCFVFVLTRESIVGVGSIFTRNLSRSSGVYSLAVELCPVQYAPPTGLCILCLCNPALSILPVCSTQICDELVKRWESDDLISPDRILMTP